MTSSRAVGALRTAVVAMAAVLASFGIMYAACARLGVNASPAILAAAIAIGLMRRPAHGSWRTMLAEFVTLPLVALGAALVGYALLNVPLLGAALFSTGIALSIWLRRFGAAAAAIGRTIALPLMAILVVPVRVEGSAKVPAVLLVIGAGAIAFVCATLTSVIAERLGIVHAAPERAARPRREGAMPIETRMALQMLAALAAAFAIGFTAFPAHWFWVVLTAFIVVSGTVARGEAIYKGIQRLGGAIAGTLVAAIVARATFPNPPAFAATVFFVLFLGIWLRPLGYAYWAACATLIFALLESSQGAPGAALFGQRLLCIAIGALCGVAATWFVFPIRTAHLVRRRVADALAALRDVVTVAPDAPDYPDRVAALERHAAELQRIAPPVRLHRAAFRIAHDAHPASLIEGTGALIAQVRAPGFDRASAGAELRRLGAILKGTNEK